MHRGRQLPPSKCKGPALPPPASPPGHPHPGLKSPSARRERAAAPSCPPGRDAGGTPRRRPSPGCARRSGEGTPLRGKGRGRRDAADRSSPHLLGGAGVQHQHQAGRLAVEAEEAQQQAVDAEPASADHQPVLVEEVQEDLVLVLQQHRHGRRPPPPVELRMRASRRALPLLRWAPPRRRPLPDSGVAVLQRRARRVFPPRARGASGEAPAGGGRRRRDRRIPRATGVGKEVGRGRICPASSPQVLVLRRAEAPSPPGVCVCGGGGCKYEIGGLPFLLQIICCLLLITCIS